jgi:hypothetical protein
MTEILAAVIATIASPEGIYGLGWLFAVAEAIFIIRQLKTENEVVSALRAELKDLQKIHNDQLLAEKENRLVDLKSIISDYKSVLDKISRNLSRLGKGGGKDV